MSQVKSWGYQLQKLDLEALSTSPFDLLVIDHAPDRVESVELFFRRAEIERLRIKPDGTPRLVLAYISIGEAERYRFYWDDAWLEDQKCPAWLGPANPQWVGNYPVEFWRPEWQRLMFGQSDSYVDRVMEAGFDGIYLDRADVYEQFKDRPSAHADMVRFVSELADHARAVKPEAIIVLQNAEELMRDKDIRARVDAIAKESLYFNADAEARPNDRSEQAAAFADLRLAQKAGRKVLVVEYLADAAKAEAARQQAEKQGFLVHFAERTLSALNTGVPERNVAVAPVPAPSLAINSQVKRPGPCG